MDDANLREALMRRPFFVFALAVAAWAAGLAVACTDQTNPSFAASGVAADAGSTPDSATGTDTGVADAPAIADAGAGSGSIAGSVSEMPFTSVMSAYWIGTPDLPTTTAIYLVGKQLSCADIGASGWSHTITPGTQIFEMILASKTPVVGHYTVSTATAPPVGSAEVQYVVAAPARNETRSTTGTIDLTSITNGVGAVGMFDVQFPSAADSGDAGDAGANGLSGTFRAAFCAGGHEP
jgi:hypothetical protein